MLITVLAAIDLDTILQVGVFLFIIISTLAGQIFSKTNQRGSKKPRPRPRPRPERQPRPEPMAGRPEQAQPWQPIEAGLPREPAHRPDLFDQPVRPEVVPVEAVPVEPVVRESVAEHVQRHIQRDGIDTSRLHSKVEHADERMASHLHEAFDHRLGRLESKEALTGTTVAKREPALKPTRAQSTAPPSDIAARIAKMMQTPADLSAAIVLNEILKRPEDRWGD